MDRLRSNANDMESEIQSTDEKKTKGFVQMFFKIGVSKNFKTSQENICVGVSF